MTTGSRLIISRENSSLHLLNHDGIPVARLSKTARTRWQDRLDTIKEIPVIALARRYKTDIKEQGFQARCRREDWEVPVVELRYLEKE